MYGPATFLSDVRGIVRANDGSKVRRLTNSVAESRSPRIENARKSVDSIIGAYRGRIAALEAAWSKYEAWHARFGLDGRKRKRATTLANLPTHLVNARIASRLTNANMARAAFAGVGRNALTNRRNSVAAELKVLVGVAAKYIKARTPAELMSAFDALAPPTFKFKKKPADAMAYIREEIVPPVRMNDWEGVVDNYEVEVTGPRFYMECHNSMAKIVLLPEGNRKNAKIPFPGLPHYRIPASRKLSVLIVKRPGRANDFVVGLSHPAKWATDAIRTAMGGGNKVAVTFIDGKGVNMRFVDPNNMAMYGAL